MAYITSFNCKHCGNVRTEVVESSQICANCRVEIARLDKENHLAKLELISFDDRVRRIEEQLYDLRLNDRLLFLESHHQRYC